MTNPLQWLFIYTDDVRFELSGDRANSVERLSRQVRTPNLRASLDRDSFAHLAGRVTNDEIRLHKSTPMFGNIFKPIFYGRFQVHEHKTTLVGTFAMGTIARIVVGVFVVFSLVMQILLLPGLLVDFSWGLFDPLLFACGGIALVWLMKIYSQRDIAWITHQLNQV